MRKKEKWMFKGAIVLANGQKAIIKKMEENHLNGVDYVYYIDCLLEGDKRSLRYHSGDITELKIPTP